MIKAVIFDCFGVLVKASLEPFYEKYLHGDPRLIEQAEELNRQTNLGVISYDKFIDEMAKLAQIPQAEAREFMDTTPVNAKLLEFIKKELKPKFKIGFLSNAAANWLDELFSKDELTLFDAFVLSYEAGVAKPEARIYEIIADKLGVRADECVFIDDRQMYVEAAQAVGMKALLFVSTEQIKRDLSDILLS